jgi:hypothetical protein
MQSTTKRKLMSFLFRSTGLAPVVGTIGWLTSGRPELIFSAGLAPVESTIASAFYAQPANHALDRGKPGRGEPRDVGRPLAGQSSPAGDKPRTWWNKNGVNGGRCDFAQPGAGVNRPSCDVRGYR